MQLSLLSLTVLLITLYTVQCAPPNFFVSPPRWPSGSSYPHLPIPSTPPFNPHIPSAPVWRVRRSPQGSVSGQILKGQGPPQASVDYNHRLIDDGRRNLNVHGGVSTHDFRHFQPQGGVNYEYHPRKDMSFGAYGNVQPSHGHLNPSVGGSFTYRFRRDVESEQFEPEPEEVESELYES